MNGLYYINYLPTQNHSSLPRRIQSIICPHNLTHYHSKALYRLWVKPAVFIDLPFKSKPLSGLLAFTLLPFIFLVQILIRFSLLYRNRFFTHPLLRKKPDRVFNFNSFRVILLVSTKYNVLCLRALSLVVCCIPHSLNS